MTKRDETAGVKAGGTIENEAREVVADATLANTEPGTALAESTVAEVEAAIAEGAVAEAEAVVAGAPTAITEEELIDRLVPGPSCPSDKTCPEISLGAGTLGSEHAAAVALAVFDWLNERHFSGSLARIPIRIISDLEYKAILYYRPECHIELSGAYVREAGLEGVTQAVLHEMVHYFFHYHGIKDTSSPLLGHSKRFQHVGDRVGLTLYH